MRGTMLLVVEVGQIRHAEVLNVPFGSAAVEHREQIDERTAALQAAHPGAVVACVPADIAE